jgi:hypothetical protein
VHEGVEAGGEFVCECGTETPRQGQGVRESPRTSRRKVVSVRVCVYLCVCVCVRERERERVHASAMHERALEREEVKSEGRADNRAGGKKRERDEESKRGRARRTEGTGRASIDLNAGNNATRSEVRDAKVLLIDTSGRSQVSFEPPLKQRSLLRPHSH